MQKIKNLFSKFNLFHYLLIFFLILISITTYIFFWFNKDNNLQNQNKQNTTNNTDNIIYISLGEDFKLKKDQIAILGDNLLQIKILDFINSSCPEDAKCVWSGLGIIFEYTNPNGEKLSGLNLVRAFGYEITIVDSDYTNYAILKIQEIVDKDLG